MRLIAKRSKQPVSGGDHRRIANAHYGHQGHYSFIRCCHVSPFAVITLFISLLIATPSWSVELATDDFNRADANPIGGNWTTIPGGPGDLQIISNKLSGTTTSQRNGAYNVTAVGDDQYSQGTILGGTGTDGPCPAVRVSAVDETFYAFCPVDIGGDAFDLYKRVAGVYTSLDTQFATWAPGDVIRIEAQGTTIRGYIGGALVASQTDSAITTGQFGILINTSGTLSQTEFDDWSGGDFAPPASGADFFARRRN